MSKPTEHTIGVGGYLTTAVLQRKRRLLLKSPFGGGAGPPPVESPLKVFNGTEWVSTGVTVVAPP